MKMACFPYIHTGNEQRNGNTIKNPRFTGTSNPFAVGHGWLVQVVLQEQRRKKKHKLSRATPSAWAIVMAEATAQNAGCSCQCEDNLQTALSLGTYWCGPKTRFFYLEHTIHFLPGFGVNLLTSKQERNKSRADKCKVFACLSKARTKSRLTCLSRTLKDWQNKRANVGKYLGFLRRSCYALTLFGLEINQPEKMFFGRDFSVTTEHVHPVAGARIAIEKQCCLD